MPELFTLTWVAERGIEKSPEFIGTHPETGDVVTLEAKSRHRLGAFDTGAPPERPAKLKADITGLARAGGEKGTPRRPHLVFIDVNHPPTR